MGVKDCRNPDEAHMEIRWNESTNPASLVLFTAYKGHNFEGWISTADFKKAESDGVLSWDEQGNPVISPKP